MQWPMQHTEYNAKLFQALSHLTAALKPGDSIKEKSHTILGGGPCNYIYVCFAIWQNIKSPVFSHISHSLKPHATLSKVKTRSGTTSKALRGL